MNKWWKSEQNEKNNKKTFFQFKLQFIRFKRKPQFIPLFLRKRQSQKETIQKKWNEKLY